MLIGILDPVIVIIIVFIWHISGDFYSYSVDFIWPLLLLFRLPCSSIFQDIYIQDMTKGQFLSWVKQIWIQSFPSPRPVALPSLPYYLPIAGGRIIGFIPFPRVLVLCEMLSVSSRIWTHVAVSISDDDNHYTTGTSTHTHTHTYIYIHIYI